MLFYKIFFYFKIGGAIKDVRQKSNNIFPNP